MGYPTVRCELIIGGFLGANRWLAEMGSRNKSENDEERGGKGDEACGEGATKSVVEE